MSAHGDKYLDVLPSLNLSFPAPNDFVIRFAAAREIMRPRMDDMPHASATAIDHRRGAVVVTGSSGNPELRPYRAGERCDLTFEKYWGNKGYVALPVLLEEPREL